MKEKSQGATEYLLMLAAALSVTAMVAGVALEIFGSLGTSIEDRVSEVENKLMDTLSGP